MRSVADKPTQPGKDITAEIDRICKLPSEERPAAWQALHRRIAATYVTKGKT
jgi:hypothetical protein